MNKCPQCSGYRTSKIDAPEGTSDFFIGSVDRGDENSINPVAGMPIQAYGCIDCKGVWFKNKDITLE